MTVSEIYTAAPTQGPEKVLESFALLNQLHIPYSRVEHEPAETMEACAAISDALGIRICKNLFLCNRQKTDFYLLTMPEDKPFHTKDLSAQIGSSRLSFAPPELMEELRGGAVRLPSLPEHRQPADSHRRSSERVPPPYRPHGHGGGPAQ